MADTARTMSDEHTVIEGYPKALARNSGAWRTRLAGCEFKVQTLREDYDQPVLRPSTVDNPERLVEYLKAELLHSVRYCDDKENLIAVMLTTRRTPIGFEVISNGTLDTLLVHPREVFKPAIVLSAAAIILAHNHPSGDPTPSEADVKVTRDLIRAGQLLKIEVLDHVIIGRPTTDGGKGWASLREMGYFYS